MERRRLVDIDLGDGAKRARFVLFAIIGVCALAAAIGYVLPGHALEYETSPHSNLDDRGFTSLVFLVLVVMLGAIGSRFRFGGGIFVGLFAIAVGLVELVFCLVEHLFSKTYSSAGDVIHILGLAGMVLTGLVLPITELILFYSARSALERADPKIPSARVVT